MSIKAIVMAALAAVLVVAADGPLLAAPCPALIQQANQQLAAMDQNAEQVQTAKGLLAEADRLHKAGHHAESVAKAQAALAALK